MITNERQYKIARKRLEALNAEIENFSEMRLIEQGIDPIVIQAQMNSLKEQHKALEREVAHYDELRAGARRTLFPNTILELGEKLIEARISRGLSQKELATRLDMKEQQVQRYEQEKYLSANLIRVASVADVLKLDFHAHFQMRDEWANEIEASPKALQSGVDPSKLPIKLMAKRGWLRDTKLPAGEVRSDTTLAMAFIEQATAGMPMNALHRQQVRAKSNVDEFALLAWKARILARSRALTKKGAISGSLDPLLVKRLVQLSARPDGPVMAVNVLRENGVCVVFEDHMPSTHLDGAAMLLDRTLPVIGLTLRHDRLDNFWFVLLHELGHVICHRERGLADGFFDDEGVEAKEQVEREADQFAQNALIPDEMWKTSFVRFTKTKEQILQFAEKCSISPAIVAGRIRRERGEYGVFSDLVGQGEVRKQITAAGLMEA